MAATPSSYWGVRRYLPSFEDVAYKATKMTMDFIVLLSLHLWAFMYGLGTMHYHYLIVGTVILIEPKVVIKMLKVVYFLTRIIRLAKNVILITIKSVRYAIAIIVPSHLKYPQGGLVRENQLPTKTSSPDESPSHFHLADVVESYDSKHSHDSTVNHESGTRHDIKDNHDRDRRAVKYSSNDILSRLDSQGGIAINVVIDTINGKVENIKNIYHCSKGKHDFCDGSDSDTICGLNNGSNIKDINTQICSDVSSGNHFKDDRKYGLGIADSSRLYDTNCHYDSGGSHATGVRNNNNTRGHGNNETHDSEERGEDLCEKLDSQDHDVIFYPHNELDRDSPQFDTSPFQHILGNQHWGGRRTFIGTRSQDHLLADSTLSMYEEETSPRRSRASTIDEMPSDACAWVINPEQCPKKQKQNVGKIISNKTPIDTRAKSCDRLKHLSIRGASPPRPRASSTDRLPPKKCAVSENSGSVRKVGMSPRRTCDLSTDMQRYNRHHSTMGVDRDDRKEAPKKRVSPSSPTNSMTKMNRKSLFESSQSSARAASPKRRITETNVTNLMKCKQSSKKIGSPTHQVPQRIRRDTYPTLSTHKATVKDSPPTVRAGAKKRISTQDQFRTASPTSLRRIAIHNTIDAYHESFATAPGEYSNDDDNVNSLLDTALEAITLPTPAYLSLSEDEAMSSIMGVGDSFTAVLNCRKRTMETLHTAFGTSGIKDTINTAVKSGDRGLLVNILSIINNKPAMLTLDVVNAVLPTVRDLLESSREDFITVSCNILKIILKDTWTPESNRDGSVCSQHWTQMYRMMKDTIRPLLSRSHPLYNTMGTHLDEISLRIDLLSEPHGTD